MIKIKLKEAIEEYRKRTGAALTYRLLAARTGLSEATLQSLGSRRDYNPTLATIERLCDALGCEPGDLLEIERKEG